MAKSKCFLEKPEWTSLFKEEIEFYGPWDRLQAKIASVYASLPGLLLDITNQSSSSTRIKDLLLRTAKLRAEVLQLRTATAGETKHRLIGPFNL